MDPINNNNKQQLPVDPVDAHVDEEEAAPDAAALVEPSSASSGPDERASTAPAPKKKYRPTHSEITDYDFSDQQVQKIIQFLKDNPCLYNKKNKSYNNNTEKRNLWKKCASLFEDCTYLQVRKFFEKKRTAFGKIENAEMKSGAVGRARTAREEEIMSHWGFFRGHIAHAPSLSTQTFSDHGESSSSMDASDMSGSIQRRKNLNKRRLPESDTNPEHAPAPASPPATSPPAPATSPAATAPAATAPAATPPAATAPAATPPAATAPAAVHVNAGEGFIERMFEKASAMMQHPPPCTSNNNLQLFSRFICNDMEDLNCDEQDACMIELVTVVKKFKSRSRQQTAQQEQQPFLHTQPQQQQQQHQYFQSPQPPRPQTPAGWMQYLAATTYGPFVANTTFQQYGTQQTIGTYAVAPSTSGAETLLSPSRTAVSDSGLAGTRVIQDLNLPSNISSMLQTPNMSPLNSPQKDRDEARTTT